MSNYKLTTDLIADCMALIPENLERLNEEQQFGIYQENQILFVFCDLLYTYGDFHNMPEMLAVATLSHCLRIIPEFQDENEEYYNLSLELASLTCNIAIEDSDYLEELEKEKEKRLENTPKTIASATLHGQGEYPPSSLEELCESYKKVMS